MLQYFTVLVQQAINGISFKVLFEVRRHQHISTSTNLRMIFQICTSLSWYFLIIPFILWGTYLFHCSAALFLPFLPLLPFLCCSPPLLCPPHLSLPPSSPMPLGSLLTASTTTKRPNSHSHRALQLPDWWSTTKHSTLLQSVWVWSALSSPHKHVVVVRFSSVMSRARVQPHPSSC